MGEYTSPKDHPQRGPGLFKVNQWAPILTQIRLTLAHGRRVKMVVHIDFRHDGHWGSTFSTDPFENQHLVGFTCSNTGL